MDQMRRLMFLFSLIVTTTSQCLLKDEKSVVCVNQGYTSVLTTFKPTIIILNLSNNKIFALSTDEAEFYLDVTQLDLSYNAIESYQNIRGVSSFRKLKILNLSGNYLRSMNFHVLLSRNTDLEELDISNNINMLLKGTPCKLTNLRKISLRNNKMGYLPLKAFRGFINLEILDLTGNALTHLPAEVITTMPNLNYVYLNGNSVTDLNGYLLEISDLEDLKRIKITKKHNRHTNMSHTETTQNTNSSLIEHVQKGTMENINKTIGNQDQNLQTETSLSNGTQEGYFSNSERYTTILCVTVLLVLLIFTACIVFLLRRNSDNRFYIYLPD